MDSFFQQKCSNCGGIKEELYIRAYTLRGRRWQLKIEAKDKHTGTIGGVFGRLNWKKLDFQGLKKELSVDIGIKKWRYTEKRQHL